MGDEEVGLFSTGRWTGTYGVLSLGQGVVARLLDSRLELGSQDMSPAGEHPVYVMLGRQSDVSGSLPVARDMGVTYNEMMVLVPYVTFRGSARNFLYMPRLYLNAFWPTFLGREVFGFEKIQKRVTGLPRNYHVEERPGQSLVAAEIDPVTTYDADDVAKGYDRLAAVFSQPLVGFRDNLLSKCELASWMTFTNFIRFPVEMSLEIADPFLVGNHFPPSYRFSGCNSGVIHTAVHLVSDWTLSWPTKNFDR